MRPRRVGEILDAGINLYLRNARTLMGLAATVVIPMQVLSAVVLLSTVPSGSDVPTGFAAFNASTQTTSDAAAVLGANAVLIVVSLIVSILTTAACVKGVSDAYLDHKPQFAASLLFAVRRFPALLGMNILLFLGLVAGLIALVIPGIWLYGVWSVAAPALLIEGLGPARSLGRSRRLVKGRWWPTAGVLIVASIMVAVVSGAFEALLVAVASLGSQPSLLAAVLVVTASGAVATIVTQPFHAAVTTILYYDLRVRREGYDLHVLAEQLGLPELSPSAEARARAEHPEAIGVPLGPESVGLPGGPPFWPPPPDWKPAS
jgi:hypothetical protein